MKRYVVHNWRKRQLEMANAAKISFGCQIGGKILWPSIQGMAMESRAAYNVFAIRYPIDHIALLLL